MKKNINYLSFVLSLLLAFSGPVAMAQLAGGFQAGAGFNANMYGSGLSQAYPPCPYPQNTIPQAIFKRSERFESSRDAINRKLSQAKKKLEAFDKDRPFLACKKTVEAAIAKQCGNGDEFSGLRAISDFDDHMRGSLFITKNTNYLKTYQVVQESLNAEKYNFSRMVAGNEGVVSGPGTNPISDDDLGAPECEDKDPDCGGGTFPPAPVVIDGGSDSCIDKYGLEDGMIHPNVCYANGLSAKYAKVCNECLKPASRYRRGLYPTKFKEKYDLDQDIALLETDLEIAQSKVDCAQQFIDSSTPDATGFKRCVLDADPEATAADYCLYCDQNGGIEKKKTDWSKWLPGILHAGLVVGGGYLAYNQQKKVQQGNWEAGYPTDDRAPWGLASQYAIGGASSVMNTFKSSGAFGCSQSPGLDGQMAQGTMNPALYGQNQFGGSPYLQAGGALGYPQNMMNSGFNAGLNGNGAMNPLGSIWQGQQMAGAQFNPQAYQAYLQQQQQAYQYQIQQGQRNLQTLTALSALQQQQQQLQQQQQQLLMSNPGFNMNGGTGMNSGAGFFGGNGAGGFNGLGGLDINFGINANGGLNSGLNSGFNSGYPPGYFPQTSSQIPFNNNPNSIWAAPGTLPTSNTNNGYISPTTSSGSNLAVPNLGL